MPREAAVRQPQCADSGGFSLHAAVRIEAHDRRRLERLSRYIARPALSDERIRVNAAGKAATGAARTAAPWELKIIAATLERAAIEKTLTQLGWTPGRHPGTGERGGLRGPRVRRRLSSARHPGAQPDSDAVMSEHLHPIRTPIREQIGVMRTRFAEHLVTRASAVSVPALMSNGSTAIHTASIRITSSTRSARLRTRPTPSSASSLSPASDRACPRQRWRGAGRHRDPRSQPERTLRAQYSTSACRSPAHRPPHLPAQASAAAGSR